jgi:hypothetical protein
MVDGRSAFSLLDSKGPDDAAATLPGETAVALRTALGG